MTSPGNPSVVDVEDMGIHDHFLVTATLSAAKPRAECTSFEARNIKGMDLNAFRSKLLSSSAYTAPKTKIDDYADQLRECVVGILNQLAPSKKMTKRCGRLSNRWISNEVVAARRSRRQLDRRYRQSRTDADRLAYRAACRWANHLIKKSQHQHFIARRKFRRRHAWSVENDQRASSHGRSTRTR